MYHLQTIEVLATTWSTLGLCQGCNFNNRMLITGFNIILNLLREPHIEVGPLFLAECSDKFELASLMPYPPELLSTNLFLYDNNSGQTEGV